MSGTAVAAVLAGASAPSLAIANPIPPALSYADLLEPVPNATARLAADDAMREQAARLQPAQYWEQQHHHHHHHHHSWQWYRNNGYYWNGGGWVIIPGYQRYAPRQWYYNRGYYWNGWAWVARPQHHHHHHHHHHHGNW
ncbi:MAG TPA: hypothetical protein VN694_14205 [Caulobacteraceae bacterium]|nr:hypothetical protein [Caulobacteraceae bacterium]